MKLAAFVILKHEIDVLELFFRINSRVFDEFYVIDTLFNNTFEVIEKLVELDKIPIKVIKNFSGSPDEIMVEEAMANTRNNGYDWAFCLSFDEFLNVEKEILIKELSNMPPDVVASIRKVTWVPKNGKFFDTPNPLWSNFQRKSSEDINLYKVGLPKDMIGRVAFSPLLHQVLSIQENALAKMLCMQCCVLDSVPVRSKEQLIVSLTEEYKLQLKGKRLHFDNPHYQKWLNIFEMYNFEIDDVLLRYAALSFYSPSPNIEYMALPLDKNVRLGRETDVIWYGKRIVDPLYFMNHIIKQLTVLVRGMRKNV